MTSDTTNLKIILIILILFCGFFGVLSPRKLDPYGNSMSYANLFASGVLVAAALVHLLSDAADDAANGNDFPFGFFACGTAFYLIFVTERLVIHYALKKMDKSDVNDIENNALMENINDEIVNDIKKGHRKSLGEEHAMQFVFLIQKKNFLSALILLIGLGLHSMLAGFALGSSTNQSNVAILGIAIIAHKFLAAFALGCPLFRSQASFLFSFFIAIIFGTLTPIGIGLGWIFSHDLDGWLSALFICLASGTFLYVAIIEILAPEFSHDIDQHKNNNNEMEHKHDTFQNIMKAFCVCVGYFGMSVLAIWV